MSLPPLPAGWDSARIYSTNETELVTLSDSDRALIVAWQRADGEASDAHLRELVAARTHAVDMSRAAAGLPSLAETDRAIAQEMGLEDYDPTIEKDLFDVAKALHQMGGEAWGFVVFKTWGYENHEREKWTEFWKRWNEGMDARLRDMGAVGDLKEGIAGKLQWWLVDHESMAGKGFDEVRECFAELVEEAEEHIPLGLDLSLALMVDEASVDSLLNGEGQSFVWGVDVDFEDDQEVEEIGDDYLGHFKIVTDALIPELWHILDAESPENLCPGTGKIYRGIVGDVEAEMAGEVL
nr:hypothetical protein CFP56_64700 [Quercus suber]